MGLSHSIPVKLPLGFALVEVKGELCDSNLDVAQEGNGIKDMDFFSSIKLKKEDAFFSPLLAQESVFCSL